MIFAVLDLGISMRRLAALVAALLAICFASPSAMASKRVALVIGNSNYQNAPALTNPANDAAAITEMFKRADFDVIDSRRDLKAQEMRRALRDFGDKARGADIAVVYFAGHGLEVDGSNYVVPVDAVLERDADAEDEAVSLNRILLAVEPATHLRLVILDACRDNPFAKKMKRTLASRSVGRGLVGVEANKPNTFIAFAAKEGSTALDGDGKNSPFSAALIKHLTTPGLDIRKAFGYVRDDVMSATGNQQEPYTTNSLGGSDVTLVPAPAGASAAGNNPNADIRRDYELAERVGTREAWDSFVAAHQTGFYSDLARAQRNKLAAEAAQAAATEKARAAAEAQARLAAEGAKASEQAKAAAQSKAAEDERLAAERNRQEAEKAKAIEEAKIASVPQAAPSAPRDASKDGKSAEPVVAALTPPAAPEAPKSDALPLADIPRLLQSELRRVGCKTGDIDSEWNASARKALSSFNDHAGTKFDVKLASLDALDAVKAKPGRVCPLDCDRGFRANGDRCVKITCDSDQVLGPNGTCRPRPERAPKVVAHRERHSPAGHGGRCFVYNGASVCE
jgi:uncharacterized caspase-like protein